VLRREPSAVGRPRIRRPPQSPPPPLLSAGGSLLVLLLETHPAAWPALAAPSPDGGPGLAPAALVAQVGAFLGAYELEAEANEVVVLAVHGGSW